MRHVQFFCILTILFLSSCTRDNLLTSATAGLDTTADTLFFDTLFTTNGSITQRFRIINTNDQKIKLSSVALAGAAPSVFRINVNGVPGPVITDIEIAANDSAQVFVNTLVPANSHMLPFIVRDSILIKWNGNQKWVQLEAWAQNARYIRNGLIQTDTEWNRDLPYVIIGPLRVAENARLRITKGTKIYLHADAPILVDGSMVVEGDSARQDRVVFSGDRLDAPYHEFPAAWPGIQFGLKSTTNRLDYAIIQNAYQGIVTEGNSGSAGPRLVLNQCIINNAWDAGLMAINSSVEANNCLISNCGKNIQIIYGGDYLFRHCTIAGFSNAMVVHKDPVLFISNVFRLNGLTQTAPLRARFINSIFWGDGGTVDDEVVAERTGNDAWHVSFTDGIWKMKSVPENLSTVNMQLNANPLFESPTGISGPASIDFRLKTGSPAIDKGQNSLLVTDLDGQPRSNGLPDIGAYEKQ